MYDDLLPHSRCCESLVELAESFIVRPQILPGYAGRRPRIACMQSRVSRESQRLREKDSR